MLNNYLHTYSYMQKYIIRPHISFTCHVYTSLVFGFWYFNAIYLSGLTFMMAIKLYPEIMLEKDTRIMHLVSLMACYEGNGVGLSYPALGWKWKNNAWLEERRTTWVFQFSFHILSEQCFSFLWALRYNCVSQSSSSKRQSCLTFRFVLYCAARVYFLPCQS